LLWLLCKKQLDNERPIEKYSEGLSACFISFLKDDFEKTQVQDELEWLLDDYKRKY